MTNRSSPTAAAGSSPSRFFLASCVVIGSVLVVLFVWLARQEFFFGDDLYFLRKTLQPRDWSEVFVSFEPRGWWSYRPLSIEVFFSVLHTIAGLDPFPYLLVSVVVHLACGYVVFRIALQLAIDRRVALFAALLKIAMYPSLNGELFWISAFQTVLGTFFYLLTVTLFVDYLLHGRRRDQVAASVAMLLALLSNELAMTLPGPLVLLAVYFQGSGGVVARLAGALRASAPMVLLLGLYLPFRYWLIFPSFLNTPGLNVPHLGWHIVWNVVAFLRILAKHSGPLQIVLLATIALGWLCAARAGLDAAGTLARRSLLLGGWLVCAMVPYLGTFFLHHRAAIVLEAPFCLLLAAHLDPIVRAAGTLRTARLVEAGMLALLVLALPYQAIASQARAPRGQVNRDLLAILAREPAVPENACVRLRTRQDESAKAIDLFLLRFNTVGLLPVFYPGRHLELPAKVGSPQVWRQKCSAVVEIEVLPGAYGPGSVELRRPDGPVG